MAKKHELSQEQALKKNVIDNIQYSRSALVLAYIGLAVGLWGVFFTTVIILFFMSQGLWGPTLAPFGVLPTILS